MQAAVLAEGVAIVFTAITLGGMVVFTGFFAPQVFRRLPEEVAAPFMREVFAPYYLFMLVTTSIGALAAFAARPDQPADAFILAFVAVGFVIARWYLMPMAHRLHDAREQGEAGADEAFGSVHRRSTFLFMAQTLAILAALLRLGLG